MKYYRGREYTVNFGNYEKGQISGGFSAEPIDLGLTEEDLLAMTDEERAEVRERLRALVEQELDLLTLPEMKSMRRFSNGESFVRELFDPPEDTIDDDRDDDRPPRRTRRRR